MKPLNKRLTINEAQRIVQCYYPNPHRLELTYVLMRNFLTIIKELLEIINSKTAIKTRETFTILDQTWVVYGTFTSVRRIK